MRELRFEPVLFEYRGAVQDALSRAGFDWCSHYSAIDLDHVLFGVEVCGIHEKRDAARIQEILRSLFPNWRYSHLMERDRTLRDPGWWVFIHRDKEE